MNTYDAEMKPKLRPVDARPVESDDDEGIAFLITDPADLATASITVSEPGLFLMSLFDGEHTLGEVGELFRRQFGQAVQEQTLADMVAGLEESRFLDGDAFEAYYDALVESYRAAPTREMFSAAELGLETGASAAIAEMLASSPSNEVISGRVSGLIAPHLDYARGAPCYSAAYSVMTNRPAPRRIIVLGTNHFGRSLGIVATGKNFETPLGITRTDVGFIEWLEGECGDLRRGEYDHVREHSVELQLLICQHLWGAEGFELVPLLCSDPCFVGADELRVFGAALRRGMDLADGDSLVIAGADWSHIGAQFGDDRELDEAFREEVRKRDQAALDKLAANDADGFLDAVASEGNVTRVCSAGCIFAAMVALADARVTTLRYHQAIDEAAQVGVTCAAAVFAE